MTAAAMDVDCYLEHANISVDDIDATIVFLQTAFPHFEVRGGGESEENGVKKRWAHVGSPVTYIALQSDSSKQEYSRRRYVDTGVNHIAFVVKDLEALATRMITKGYKQSFKAPDHPFRRRIYFYDESNNEYEFVQYLSNKFSERNDYSDSK